MKKTLKRFGPHKMAAKGQAKKFSRGGMRSRGKARK